MNLGTPALLLLPDKNAVQQIKARESRAMESSERVIAC